LVCCKLFTCGYMYYMWLYVYVVTCGWCAVNCLHVVICATCGYVWLHVVVGVL